MSNRTVPKEVLVSVYQPQRPLHFPEKYEKGKQGSHLKLHAHDISKDQTQCVPSPPRPLCSHHHHYHYFNLILRFNFPELCTEGSCEYTADGHGSSRTIASEDKEIKNKLCHVATFMFRLSSWLTEKSLLKPILRRLSGLSFPARGSGETRKQVKGTRSPVAFYCRLELGVQQGSPYKCKAVRGSLSLLPALKSIFKTPCFPHIF